MRTHRTTLRALMVLLTLTTGGQASIAACVRQGPPNTRIDHCTRFLQSRPVNVAAIEAHVIRGEAYARKGMGDEALRDFSAALKAKPGHNPALIGRGRVLLAKRNYDAAIADLSLALKGAPNNSSVLIVRGYAFLASNKLNLALDDFSLALKQDATNVVALNNRGLAYKRLGKRSLAISDFTKALELNPLYALAYANRGYTYEALGKKQDAIEDLRRALIVDPTLTDAQRRLKKLAGSSRFTINSARQISEGRSLAEKNCAWCHAIDAAGKSTKASAPAFRDLRDRYPILSLRSPISRAIAAPHDAMPEFHLKSEDVDRLIAYINSMSK